jgi:hypothetical protein
MIKIKITEEQILNIVKRIINESQEKIDSILDKINQVGVGGLSKKEKEYLDYHANTGDYLDDEELITATDRASSGETWVFDGVQGIPRMEFQYETTEENIDEIVHTGYLTVNNDQFYGEIYCNNEGNYSLCNFESDESVNLFETYEGLEREIEAFLSTVCDDLKSDLMT